MKKENSKGHQKGIKGALKWRQKGIKRKLNEYGKYR